MATFEEMKRGFTGGQWEALERKTFLAAGGEQTGAETLKGVLDGDYEFVVREATPKLVDANGRAIPFKDIPGGTTDANRDYYLDAFMVDHTRGLGQITRELAGGNPFIATEDFVRRAVVALDKVAAHKQTANLLKGPFFPWALPQMQAGDLGTFLDETLLPAVGRAYETAFPDRKFYNHRKSTLARQVTVLDPRQSALIQALCDGPVVGVTFPTALQGFSIPADRAMMSKLPEFYGLSGLDTVACMIMYPAMLARDWNTPGYDMASFQWRSAEYSLNFRAYDGELGFGRRDLSAHVNYSGGLFVRG